MLQRIFPWSIPLFPKKPTLNSDTNEAQDFILKCRLDNLVMVRGKNSNGVKTLVLLGNKEVHMEFD